MTNLFDRLIDGLTKVAEVDAKISRMSEIKAKIRDLQSKCGSCKFFMILNDCPYEKVSMNGRQTGRSINDWKCDKFIITNLDKEFIEQLQNELKELQ